MSNYEILKSSEKELHNSFMKYCDHVYEMWKMILKISTNSKNNAQTFEAIQKMEEQSNHLEASIQDDCIWAISKNQPFANHLRYIIAVLNSIKDLERMADYAYSASRFFEKRAVNDEVKLLIHNLTNDAIKTMKKVFDSLKSKPAIETYKITKTSHEIFRKEYKDMIDKLVLLIKDNSPKEVAAMFHGGIIVLKHVERLIDHLANVSENFVFIKQSDFFFDKQSKID